MRAVLLQPPFFRAVGSHNDRLPLELCYASAYLAAAEIEHVVLNADWTGSDSYVSWRQLFDQFDLFQSAVDGQSPLYSETVERVMHHNPDVVVLSAGDSLIPVLDCGHPWIGARLSDMLRQHGVKTIGVGPFFGSADGVFGAHFDAIVGGMCPTVIVQAVQATVRNGERATYRGDEPPLGVLPEFAHLLPHGQQNDYVITSFGCPYGCSYCYAPRILRGQKPVPAELVGRDIMRREAKMLYIRDMIFPLSVKRLQELRPWMEGLQYMCDARADLLTGPLLEAARDCGVRRLKVGIEVLDDAALKRMNKGEGVGQIKRGIALAREFEMELVVYVLLGGMYADRDAYDRTYEFVEELQPEGVVVSVASYQTFDRHYRYDAHFSPFAAMQWRVDHGILERFLELQDRLRRSP